MKLNDAEKAVLRGILTELERWRAVDPVSFNDMWDRNERGRSLTAWLDARDGYVRPEPARWLGKALTPSDHVATSRTYASLERKGLIERLAFENSNKTARLFLTPEGEAVAKRLQRQTAKMIREANRQCLEILQRMAAPPAAD